MRKKSRITANEFFVFLWILFVAAVFLYKNVTAWKASYEFNQMSGYVKQGVMLAHDSSLRIPDHIAATKEFAAYCNQIDNLRHPDQIKNSVVEEGPYKGIYCGCLSQNHNSDFIEYKLFSDKVVYRCHDEIYSTTLIPDSLKEKE